MESEQFEREWRELLIKRLKSVQGVLRRDAARDKKKQEEAQILAAGFTTVEEAHEAYGWDAISWEQYERVKLILEQDPNAFNQAYHALMRISRYIGDLEGDIKQVQADREFEKKLTDYRERREWENEQDRN